MKKTIDNLILAIKGIVYIYLPVIFMLFIIYEVILKRPMIIFSGNTLIFVFIVGIWAIRNYTQNTVEQNIEDFISLKNSIDQGRWEILEQGDKKIIVKPRFDHPFSLLIDDKVQIDYSDQKVIISGPWYYTHNMVKDIDGRPSFWTRKAANIVGLIIVIVLVSIPVFEDLGMPWKIKKNLHNSLVGKIQVIQIDSGDRIGNSIQNTNNQGQGVESEDYIFYVERDLNLVRVNKDYTDKIYLIQKSQGSNISRINLAGDWIFYTSGKNLNRIRIDGTNNQTIYKSGYALDVHYKDNYLYFINLADRHNVYKIDINGRNLQRLLNVNASDIALYDNKIIVSYRDNNNSYVKSFSLDGLQESLELEVLANNLVRWDGYYYFIGEDSKFYRNKTDGITAPQLLVDKKVSSFVITESGIFYSLHAEDVGYPGEDIFKIDLDGSGTTLVLETKRVGGFTKVGEHIIFHSADINFESEIKRLNIFTNKIDHIRKDASIKEPHTPIINDNISIDYSGIEEFLGNLSQKEITNLFSDIANEIFSDEDYEDNLDSILQNAFAEHGIDISDKIEDVKSGLIIKRSTID